MRSSSSADRSTRARAPLLALSLLALSTLTPGCYTTHVIVGQLSIMAGREDIEDVLEDSTVAADAKEKLALVLAVRRFAIEELGLRETGSYLQLYDTGQRPVAWNVSASDPDAFAPYTWTFPIVGRMPYIGFFDEALARAEGERLREEGFDALVLPVPAYSTLGWFDDPFFSSMLRYDEATIADIVIHEMAHATVFIDDDAEFNETLATFIGQEGAELFFLARGGPDDPALRAAHEDRRQRELFNRELKTLKETLWRLFEATGDRDDKLRLKDEAIAAWKARFARDIKPQLTDGAYDYVLEEQVEFNNAFLMMFDRYHGEVDLFVELHEHHGRDLPATIRTLRALAEEDDPRAALEQRVADVRRLLAAHPAVAVPTR